MNKQISELIGKISEVCTKINLNKNNDCAFLRIYGHVNKIDIEYCENKDDFYKVLIYKEFYIENMNLTDQNLIEELKDLLEILNKINNK